MTYFFDTYAIIEMEKGSLSYERFKEFKIVTSVLNIGETYQLILKKHGKFIADKWYKESNFELLEISSDVMVEAIYFRFINRGINLSLVDCVGYILSLRNNLKFLTGDRAFKGMKNVELVR